MDTRTARCAFRANAPVVDRAGTHPEARCTYQCTAQCTSAGDETATHGSRERCALATLLRVGWNRGKHSSRAINRKIEIATCHHNSKPLCSRCHSWLLLSSCTRSRESCLPLARLRKSARHSRCARATHNSMRRTALVTALPAIAHKHCSLTMRSTPALAS